MRRFLKYIESASYRKWLEDHFGMINTRDILNLIICSGADIRQKLSDLKILSDNMDDSDVYRYDIQRSIKKFERAVGLMENTVHGTIFYPSRCSYVKALKRLFFTLALKKQPIYRGSIQMKKTFSAIS